MGFCMSRKESWFHSVYYTMSHCERVVESATCLSVTKGQVLPHVLMSLFPEILSLLLSFFVSHLIVNPAREEYTVGG